MWLWGANPWAHSSDLPTPGDSTPTVLARRHWSGHQALGASCRTTADGGLPNSHRPEDLARSSHRTQKKKKKTLLTPCLLRTSTAGRAARLPKTRSSLCTCSARFYAWPATAASSWSFSGPITCTCPTPCWWSLWHSRTFACHSCGMSPRSRTRQRRSWTVRTAAIVMMMQAAVWGKRSVWSEEYKRVRLCL